RGSADLQGALIFMLEDGVMKLLAVCGRNIHVSPSPAVGLEKLPNLNINISRKTRILAGGQDYRP
ncbi:MAG TPA: hypothetical protein VE398_21555, partial [Acidobacteriota bacterium]|nr:hypothetical protein [Acidobacteriota bacterium]